MTQRRHRTNTFEVTGTTSTGSVFFSSDPLTASLSATGAAQPTPGVINNILGTGGRALFISNTALGSNVDFTGSIVNDTLGNGVLVSSDAGSVSLGDINSTNSLSNGLDILNDSGVVTVNGVVTVANATGDSINISGPDVDGQRIIHGPRCGSR